MLTSHHGGRMIIILHEGISLLMMVSNASLCPYYVIMGNFIITVLLMYKNVYTPGAMVLFDWLTRNCGIHRAIFNGFSATKFPTFKSLIYFRRFRPPTRVPWGALTRYPQTKHIVKTTLTIILSKPLLIIWSITFWCQKNAPYYNLRRLVKHTSHQVHLHLQLKCWCLRAVVSGRLCQSWVMSVLVCVHDLLGVGLSWDGSVMVWQAVFVSSWLDSFWQWWNFSLFHGWAKCLVSSMLSMRWTGKHPISPPLTPTRDALQSIFAKHVLSFSALLCCSGILSQMAKSGFVTI